MSKHPSYFQLDRLRCSDQVPMEITKHVDGCAKCTSYLAALTPDDIPPKWVRDMEKQRLPLADRSRRWIWTSGFATALVAATVLLIFRADAPIKENAFTTVKGAPSLGLYIKRGNQVLLWNGQSPVVPGDKLRLKVVPEEFEYVAVFAEGSSKPLLYEGRLAPNTEQMLPPTWEVDSDPSAEVLRVVLGRVPLDTRSIESALLHEDSWSTKLTIVKDTRNGTKK